jgi:hypothetical protein
MEKTLRLVISSKLVNRQKFLDALDERLTPLMKQVTAPAHLVVCGLWDLGINSAVQLGSHVQHTSARHKKKKNISRLNPKMQRVEEFGVRSNQTD